MAHHGNHQHERLKIVAKVSFNNLHAFLFSQTMKENLLRTFSWLEADTLKQNTRTEWQPFLHNLCFLHGALRLRGRLGRGGWNCPSDFLKIGNSQFHVRTM